MSFGAIPPAVAFARFFNVLRQLNGIVAGTLGMDWWRFLLFNAAGAALWVLGTFHLSEHISVITRAARHFGVAGGIMAGVALIGSLALLWRRLHRGRSPTDGRPEP